MYGYGSVGIIYSSVIFAFLAAVRYWLYRDRLRIPLRLMYVIVAMICLISGGAWLMAGGVSSVDYDVFRISFSIFMFALSCVIIKAPITEHAFSYSFILAFTAAVETTASYIRLNFIPGAPDYAYPVISILIIAAAFVPGVRSLERMVVRVSELGSDKVWRWLDLACFSFLIMNLITARPHPADMSLYYPIGRYLMLLGMVGIYKTVIRIMDVVRAAADARAELSISRRRVEIQQSYYERMLRQMEEVRRQRHDLRHHRAMLAGLIKSGDAEALRKYFDDTEIEQAIPVTGNLAADSVLLYYTDVARALDVKMETSLAIGRKMPISDSDMCVILGNLLENAVDAQRYLPPEKRYIRAMAKGDETHLTLAVDNVFDGVLKIENGAYLSRKDGAEHGLGLASVRAVCEKYGGVLQITTDDGMFMAGVVIGL